MSVSEEPCIKMINTAVEPRLGRVRHALFDFDGTLSVLRQGWEPVMESVMLEAICAGREPWPELVSEVRQYIDTSTGQLTIIQMEWLAEAVRRYGLAADPLTPAEYKRLYRDAIMVSVSERLDRVASGQESPDTYLMTGSAEFLRELAGRGVKMYMASGSDHVDVVHEAEVLGLAPYLNGGIYGALDASAANAKARIIQRILDDHQLSGSELLVVGDGPVEIIEARARGAIALGMASDEVQRRGWNTHKIERLTRAGADLLIPDFSCSSELVGLLVS